jgi:hypothetical protein
MSFSYPDERGSRFLQNVGSILLKYDVDVLSTPPIFAD